MVIKASAFLWSCPHGDLHFATITLSDGQIFPFLTLEQGKNKLCDLFNTEVISREEFANLASRIVNINLPESYARMAEDLGVPTDVVEEACDEAAIYFKDIMEMPPEMPDNSSCTNFPDFPVTWIM
jgi:hypothetical protein